MAIPNETLITLYKSLNHPAKAGKKWVTYRRDVIEGAFDVLNQLLKKEVVESDRHE